MDQVALALKMKRVTIWLDTRWRSDGFMSKQFNGAPFGGSYVTIDPARQGPTASANINRVYLCGAEPGLKPDGLQQLIALFADAGVRRFFVWLSPGPDIDKVRGWLTQAGLSPNPWVTYPTLVREHCEPVQFKTGLDIREVGADEVAVAREPLGETMWPEYATSAGKEGCYHFMAFDRDRPVATAELCVFEDVGYLANASTNEADRRRGAQQALIASRIAAAKRIGCSTLVVETLTILEQSLRNLVRAGFAKVYDKDVYMWDADKAQARS